MTELYLFVLPIPVIWGLKMPLRRRLGVLAIFGTGLISVAASAIGLWVRILNAQSPDFFWWLAPTLTLSAVETSTAIIVASAPYLPAFFRRHPVKLSIPSFLRHHQSARRTGSEVLPSFVRKLDNHSRK